jgi:hypothetical protein
VFKGIDVLLALLGIFSPTAIATLDLGTIVYCNSL